MDGERPAHLVLDCGTGTETYTPLSDQEWAEHRQALAAAHAEAQDRAAEAEAKAAEDKRVRALVDAHPDPLVKLLARRAGLA